jgi:hypothetical protein
MKLKMKICKKCWMKKLEGDGIEHNFKKWKWNGSMLCAETITDNTGRVMRICDFEIVPLECPYRLEQLLRD